MADWHNRSKINGDVVEFQYVPKEKVRDVQYVYVWDLDKTYLDTNFGTLKEVWRTIREKAFQKKNIPGTQLLVRALTEQQEGKIFAIYFITASPPQMEEAIRAKLEYDGIHPFGAFFKDNLRNLKPSLLWRLTEQIGYKLQAILQLRGILKSDVQQYLWGDDSESDVIIYSLYSDICARRIPEAELRSILEGLNVLPIQIDAIIESQSQIPVHDPVFKIYINLISDTDPDYYSKFGRRVVPTYNSFQIALNLFQDRRIEVATLKNIALDLLTNYAFSVDELLWSLEDFIQRGFLKSESVDNVIKTLKDANVLPGHFSLGEKTIKSLMSGESQLEWVPSKIDYLNDYR